MKANILIRIAALGALLLSAAACVFPFPVEADQDGDLPLVIEGDLKIGGTTTVSVSHVRPLKKGSGAVGNFSVEGYVEGEDGTRVEGQSQVWGSEKRRISFDTGQLRGDQRYRLHLETVSGSNGKKEVVESDWLTVTQAPVIDDLSYSHHPEFEELWIGLSMHCPGEHHFRWSFNEEWEYHSDELSSLYCRKGNGKVIDFHMPVKYYCWSSKNSGKINIFSTANQTDDRFEELAFHSIPLRDLRLQTMYRLTVRLSAMSEDAYNYWYNIQQNSEGQGSIFSTTPSEMSSNLHCLTNPSQQIIGFLSAAAEGTSRIIYDNSLNNYYIKGTPIASLEEFEALNDSTTNMSWLSKGYLPYSGRSDGSADILEVVTWIPRQCTDCTVQGGSPIAPEDWPTGHKNYIVDERY